MVLLAIQVGKPAPDPAGIGAVGSGLNNHFIFSLLEYKEMGCLCIFFPLFADFHHRFVHWFFHQFHFFVRTSDWVW